MKNKFNFLFLSLLLSIAFLSVVSAQTISGTTLTSEVLNSSFIISPDCEISLDLLNITDNFIYLENISYDCNGLGDYSASFFNLSTPNTIYYSSQLPGKTVEQNICNNIGSSFSNLTKMIPLMIIVFITGVSVFLLRGSNEGLNSSSDFGIIILIASIILVMGGLIITNIAGGTC
jgi:hypothetical protein